MINLKVNACKCNTNLTESLLGATLLTAGDSDLLESSLCFKTMFPPSGVSGPFLVGDVSDFTRATSIVKEQISCN